MYYFCRSLHCPEHAYAQAARLDAHVLAVLEEAVSEADPSTWVVVPGDDREVEEAEAALEEARGLDSWLADTKLRGILGPDRYAGATADRVAVVNKAEADLEAARERHGGRYELVARLWLQEWGWAERKPKEGVRIEDDQVGRRVEGARAAERGRRGRAALAPRCASRPPVVNQPDIRTSRATTGATVTCRGRSMGGVG